MCLFVPPFFEEGGGGAGGDYYFFGVCVCVCVLTPHQINITKILSKSNIQDLPKFTPQ